jgi:Ca-activated chloride channel family protein
LPGGFTLALSILKKTRGSQKLLVLITDGEDLENNWPDALKELQKEKITVFTVGVGIPAGAPIPIIDENGKTSGWKKDAQGNIVKSRLDEGTLIRIASACQEPFINILKNYERKLLAQKVKSKKIERFQYPLLLAVMLLVFEMVLSDRKITWQKKQS